MDVTLDPGKKERSKGRILWIMGGVFAVLAGITSYLVFAYDISPPEDTWLLPEPFAPASGTHSIPEFAKKAKGLLEAANSDQAKLPEDIWMVSAKKVKEGRAFLDKHRAALEEMNAFMTANQGPLPFPEGDKGLTSTVDYSYLPMFQYGARLAAMQARALAQEGKMRESLEQSLALIRLGRQLVEHDASLMQWLMGITIQSIGRVALEYAANLHPFREEDLMLVENTLASSEISSRDFKSTMRVEYLSFKRSLVDLKREVSSSPTSFRLLGIPAWEGLAMKSNMTFATVLDLERPVFAACDKDWCELLLAGTEMFEKSQRPQNDRIQRYFSANIGGNALLGYHFQNEERVYEMSVRTAAYHRQMILMLALRRFELEKGVLPQKLEELCPKHLATVPLDPYDNQPMRWKPVTHIVYALGKNLKDDGGSVTKPVSPNDRDAGMVYWWNKPAATLPPAR